VVNGEFGMPAVPTLDELEDWANGTGKWASVPVVYAPPVRYEVLSEREPGKWVRVLGPTTRVRAEQWWVLSCRDGGPAMRVQEVGASG
jgi:hypothetical protein